MKILIAADMEGVTGVVHWDQVSPNHAEYPRFRRLMTEDVNAAIRGAFDGGAEEVVVTDGHAYGRNILIEALDDRARLNSGMPSPLGMVQGVDAGVAGVMFVGYHAWMGSEGGILDHTWSDERVANVRLNGQICGETALNAAVCGHFGARPLMIAGDQTVCSQAIETLGALETAAVKQASGRMSAECLAPFAAQKMIYEAAQRAVRRLLAGQAPEPYRLATPINLEIDFNQSEMADKAMLLPGAVRGPGRRITYTASDMITIYQAFRALIALAR